MRSGAEPAAVENALLRESGVNGATESTLHGTVQREDSQDHRSRPTKKKIWGGGSEDAEMHVRVCITGDDEMCGAPHSSLLLSVTAECSLRSTSPASSGSSGVSRSFLTRSALDLDRCGGSARARGFGRCSAMDRGDATGETAPACSALYLLKLLAQLWSLSIAVYCH